ncbi:MAG: response regulator [Anaerolineae bacterium]|nr:response regulator [Anaerolineae bacterium]
MNILVLDDNPHRIRFFQNGLKSHKLTICRHARAAIHALKNHPFDMMFLDHDLKGKPADPDDENSGSEVARYIAEQEIGCPCIILHTENRTGQEAMEGILSQCHVIPYSKLKKMGLSKIVASLSEPINNNPPQMA